LTANAMRKPIAEGAKNEFERSSVDAFRNVV